VSWPDGRAWLAAGILLLGILGGACSGARRGAALDARFADGNDAYERGEYSEAVSIYREVASSGLISPALHYNLGNALFKAGILGEAILEYERALALDPGDPDSRENLEYLRTLTVDEITPAASPLSALGIPFLLGLTTPSQDAVVVLTGWILAGGAVGVGVTARRERLRRIAWYLAGALIVPVIIAGAALATKTTMESSRQYGILLVQEEEVLSGAGEENPALFTVHEGLKVRIRGGAEGWTQISLENGLTGWLPNDSLGLI
jgi:tetratricopeptide (TPR) repeat protein